MTDRIRIRGERCSNCGYYRRMRTSAFDGLRGTCLVGWPVKADYVHWNQWCVHHKPGADHLVDR